MPFFGVQFSAGSRDSSVSTLDPPLQLVKLIVRSIKFTKKEQRRDITKFLIVVEMLTAQLMIRAKKNMCLDYNMQLKHPKKKGFILALIGCSSLSMSDLVELINWSITFTKKENQQRYNNICSILLWTIMVQLMIRAKDIYVIRTVEAFELMKFNMGRWIAVQQAPEGSAGSAVPWSGHHFSLKMATSQTQ